MTRNRTRIVPAAILSCALCGCGPALEETSRTVSVDNYLGSYQYRSDLPWGAVPVCPSRSKLVVGQLSLQAGAVSFSRVEGSGTGAWSVPPLQGTGELSVLARNARIGVGGRWGATRTGWVSLGWMERGDGGTHLYGEVAAGVAKSVSGVDYVSIRTTTQSGMSAGDTSSGHVEPRIWKGFARFTVGLLPSGSGPWATLQVVPVWLVTQWPGGYRENFTLYGDTAHPVDIEGERTNRENHQSTTTLVGLGAGWTLPLGSHAMSVGARYSVHQLYQLEMLAQFTSEF